MAEAAKKEAATAAAAEATKPGAPEGAEAGVAPSKAKKVITFAIAGLLSGGLGITAAIVTHKKVPEPQVTTIVKPKAPTPLDAFKSKETIGLPPVITNLSDNGVSVSGRFTIYLDVRCKDQLTLDALKEACAKGKELDARIHDSLIQLFSSKTSAELKSKEVIKLEIIDALKPMLFEDSEMGALADVYFLEFVVQ